MTRRRAVTAFPIAMALAACTAVCAIPAVSLAAEVPETPTADELLTRSIAYHDPDGRFLGAAHRLVLAEERPDGPGRSTELLIDVAGSRFAFSEQGEKGSRHGVLAGDTCHDLRDLPEPRRPLDCDRLQWIRNYYVYLWGLPMKLRDPGTHLGAVERTTYQDQDVWGLRVTYDAEVGKDVWIVYFRIDDAALAGYRFYHDEEAGDGEYIVLEGETVSVDGKIRLPARRTWYTHQGDRLLGTDILESIEPGDSAEGH